jgi:hypothetical protein
LEQSFKAATLRQKAVKFSLTGLDLRLQILSKPNCQPFVGKKYQSICRLLQIARDLKQILEKPLD